MRYCASLAEARLPRRWERMDSIRYYLALLLVIGVPPPCVYWLIIHPLAQFWRDVGPRWTFTIVGTLVVATAAGLFLARASLLSVEFGTRSPLVVAGLLLLAAGMWVEVHCRRHLGIGTLVGLPEVDPARYTPKLLTEGIYGRIRHPRYVAGVLSLLSLALVANYLVAYVVVVLMVPTLYLIAILEERELLERFGAEYEAYSRRVPRFVPKLGP
jgi:protein-S-isoprenylcysteine O-methyltransferase Ste14